MSFGSWGFWNLANAKSCRVVRFFLWPNNGNHLESNDGNQRRRSQSERDTNLTGHQRTSWPETTTTKTFYIWEYIYIYIGFVCVRGSSVERRNIFKCFGIASRNRFRVRWSRQIHKKKCPCDATRGADFWWDERKDCLHWLMVKFRKLGKFNHHLRHAIAAHTPNSSSKWSLTLGNWQKKGNKHCMKLIEQQQSTHGNCYIENNMRQPICQGILGNI